MYYEKMNSILEDLENKEIDIAGGSVVAMNLATINSLIKYICNLTLGKKKYEDMQEVVQEIYVQADELKRKSLQVIDKDKEVLEEILKVYRIRNDYPNNYENICKSAVMFCMEVLNLAYETLNLSNRISKVGNRMLASDFEICKNYSFASVKSAIVNVDINLKSIKDNEFIKIVKKRCDEILEEAKCDK